MLVHAAGVSRLSSSTLRCPESPETQRQTEQRIPIGHHSLQSHRDVHGTPMHYQPASCVTPSPTKLYVQYKYEHFVHCMVS
jgi:hypothetical protein